MFGSRPKENRIQPAQDAGRPSQGHHRTTAAQVPCPRFASATSRLPGQIIQVVRRTLVQKILSVLSVGTTAQWHADA